MSKLPLRPNVCMLIVNRDGKILLCERLGEPGVWQFPQGGVEGGATLEESVIRELEEELGILSARIRIVKKLNATHEYEFAMIPEYAVGKWRGQSQTFWLVEFLGDDSEIKLDLHVPEFGAYRWCSADEVRKLAERKRLGGYEAPLLEVEAYLRSIP